MFTVLTSIMLNPSFLRLQNVLYANSIYTYCYILQTSRKYQLLPTRKCTEEKCKLYVVYVRDISWRRHRNLTSSPNMGLFFCSKSGTNTKADFAKPGHAWKLPEEEVLVIQLCPTLHDLGMDCSPPGSSVRGILVGGHSLLCTRRSFI